MANATQGQHQNQRQTFRQSVEVPIEVSITGVPVPIHATLINISATGARMRSLISIEKDSSIRFPLRTSGKTIEIRGRIASRNKPIGQALYEYGIAFDRISTADQDSVVQAVMEFQRREAAARADEKEPPSIPGATGKQKRAAYRANVAFEVRYKKVGRAGSSTAQANDLSVGGLRLITDEVFPKNALLSFEFTLPSEVLNVFKGKIAEAEISPFGVRAEWKPREGQRPFEQMQLTGRVVTRLKDSYGRAVFGIQFVDVDAFTREEIQRFIHAAQVYRLHTNQGLRS